MRHIFFFLQRDTFAEACKCTEFADEKRFTLKVELIQFMRLE